MYVAADDGGGDGTGGYIGGADGATSIVGVGPAFCVFVRALSPNLSLHERCGCIGGGTEGYVVVVLPLVGGGGGAAAASP